MRESFREMTIHCTGCGRDETFVARSGPQLFELAEAEGWTTSSWSEEKGEWAMCQACRPEERAAVQ